MGASIVTSAVKHGGNACFRHHADPLVEWAEREMKIPEG
jgi:hypothetical protein